MGSRNKKNKRKQKNRGRPHKPGHPQPGPLGDVMVIATPPGEAKMSEVLKKFVEPYYAECKTEEDVRKLLSLAALIWNTALLPSSDREPIIQTLVEAVPPEDRRLIREHVEEMLHRKATYFAGNTRAIVSYEMTMTPTGLHLSVMSTFGSG